MEGKTKEGKIVMKSKSDKNIQTSLAMMEKMMGTLSLASLGIKRKSYPLKVNKLWKRRCNS